jgi:hypothetical protein
MTRSHRSSSSRSLGLLGLYLLVFVFSTVTSAMLTGCGGADESDSSGPLPLETWATSGQKPTSSTSRNGTSSTASTSGTGTDTDTTSTTPAPTTATDAGSTTTTPTPAADAATTCVATTDEGNSAGVGKFCTSDSACGSGLLCSSDFNAPAGDTFCSKICTTDADCGGDGATCFAAMGTHACVTAACAPVAATLF